MKQQIRHIIKKVDLKRLIPIALGLSMIMFFPMQADGQNSTKKRSAGKVENSKTTRQTASSGNTGKSGTKVSGKGKTTSSKRKGSGNKSGSGKSKKSGTTQSKVTSADVKRQQEATQKEIQQTKKKIAENDRFIAKGIAELQKLEGDIDESRKEVGQITKRVNMLSSNIDTLEKRIGKEEARLKRMREDYKKAVKKMRLSGRRNSTLSFLFSSRSFAEAMRRMRYLKDFSIWKEEQSAEIQKTVKELKTQREALSLAKREHGVALRNQLAAQQKLQAQHTAQDKVVVELKRNGEALNTHLAKKQAEANKLKSQVANLIAQEEARRIEREAKARAEREAKAKADAEAKAKAERERLQAEAARKRESESVTKVEPDKGKTAFAKRKNQEEPKVPKSEKNRKEETLAKNTPQKEQQPQGATDIKSNKNKGDKNYAEARKRKPRSQGNVLKGASTPSSKNTATTTASVATGDFEKMQGSLPRPVAGYFKVTSPFGRQQLPDLPGVEYDNPGIDAEVGKGAAVQAVYPGTVSAVYVLPGFSTVVILNHGTYYTVYGNIASASVKGGENVKQGQKLGNLSIDKDDPSHSTIHFEVWKKRDKLNPMKWIK